jgi:hypothetical protein
VPKKGIRDPVHTDLTRACAKRATAHRLGYLMREGADIEYRDEARCTPLHHAVFGGSVDTVRWILQAGADVNAENDWFGTPLCLAAIRGDLAITELLIEHNADVNQDCSNLGSAAHAACRSGNIAIVHALDAGGARWNVRRKTCVDALSHLCQLSRDEGSLVPYHKSLATQACHDQSPKAIADNFCHNRVADFCSGPEKGLPVNGTSQPTTLPKKEAPKPRRTPGTSKTSAERHSRAASVSAAPPSSYPSQPPWHNSASLGGEYFYNPETDEVVLKTGQRIARPPTVPVHALLPAAWVDTLKSQYPDSPSAGHPSQPPWHHSATLGGEYYYDPQTDVIVMKDRRRFQCPPNVPRHTLLPASWVDPNSDSSPGSTRPHSNDGSREQTPSTGLPYLRSTASAARTKMQALTREMDQTGLSPGEKSHGHRDPQYMISGSLDTYEVIHPDYKIRDRLFFRKGRVFVASWVESAGKRQTPRTDVFVVICKGVDHCNALMIVTYGGQGVAKCGVKKSEHALIYTGCTAPHARSNELPKAGEAGMQPIPIRVDPLSSISTLDPMSRIDLGKITIVQHDVKVKPLGLVNPDSMDALLDQHREVWNTPEGRPVEKRGDPPHHRFDPRDKPLHDTRGKASYDPRGPLHGMQGEDHDGNDDSEEDDDDSDANDSEADDDDEEE